MNTSSETLKTSIIDNGIQGLKESFAPDTRLDYRFLPVNQPFEPDLTDTDLLIVPNGSDHLAMLEAKPRVQQLLDRGGALFCFDGWFTDWVPGNRWVMDNGKATRDIRYRVADDPTGLMRDLDIDEFTFHHGISGWWSCGYIEAAPGAWVLLEDTWGRPILVLDRVSTAGTLFLSASGPLPLGRDPEYALNRLYCRAIDLVLFERQAQTGDSDPRT